jgi:phage FluMu protein Com
MENLENKSENPAPTHLNLNKDLNADLFSKSSKNTKIQEATTLTKIQEATTLTKNQEAKPMIEGANLWAHFNVRCPGCNKLYRVDSREIKSTQPHFSCSACHVVFSFDFPPKQLARVETRVVQVSTSAINKSADVASNSVSSHYDVLKSNNDHRTVGDSGAVGVGAVNTLGVGKTLPRFGKTSNLQFQEGEAALKSCPKCAAKNPRLSKECIKCGVIFEKLENLPLDPKIGALPSLVRMWQDLMRDYENLAKHLEFVDRCEDLEALPFAMSKYQELKSIQPQDSLAEEMFQAVWLKNFRHRAEKIPGMRRLLDRTEGAWQKAVQALPWARILRFSPYVVSSMMILVGLINQGSRNLVGTGSALLFLSLGILFLWKGRIHWKDLW